MPTSMTPVAGVLAWVHVGAYNEGPHTTWEKLGGFRLVFTLSWFHFLPLLSNVCRITWEVLGSSERSGRPGKDTGEGPGRCVGG